MPSNSVRLARLQRLQSQAGEPAQPKEVADPHYAAEMCCGNKKKGISQTLAESKTSGKIVTLANVSALSPQQDGEGFMCGICNQRYVQEKKSGSLFDRLFLRFFPSRS